MSASHEGAENEGVGLGAGGLCVAATVAVVRSGTVYETLGEWGGGPAWLGPFIFFTLCIVWSKTQKRWRPDHHHQLVKKKREGALLVWSGVEGRGGVCLCILEGTET